MAKHSIGILTIARFLQIWSLIQDSSSLQNTIQSSTSSARKINKGLDLWLAERLKAGNDTPLPWSSPDELYDTINLVQEGSTPFMTVKLKYNGQLGDEPPMWMTQTYELCLQDSRKLLHNQLATTDFAIQFNTRPYRQFDHKGDCNWSNLMLGDWAWNEADTITKDPRTHGSMQQTNKKQSVLNSRGPSIVQGPILPTIQNRSGLQELFKDGVQTSPDNLDVNYKAAHQRRHERTDLIIECFDTGTVWDYYGIQTDVVPFTHGFPQGDIHVLLSPDLLHQLIKGTFKDHLVTWVNEFLHIRYRETCALEIIHDIARRISAVPPFAGL
ncbi:hypothetical protein B0H34DRAFT_679435 [Crassisporium funariophilum]|nr:hypothetical protein B0H34DRAFT_679435 [Crassisporium funariophilum]